MDTTTTYQTTANEYRALAKQNSESAEQALREANNAKAEGNMYEYAYQMENYERYSKRAAMALNAINR